MKRLFLQIFAWLAILLGVGLMLQPTVSRYLTEQKSTKTVQKFVQAAEAAAPAAPETSAAEPARAYPELYDAFLAYNQQLFAQGQSGLKDPFAYETPAFDLTGCGLPDDVIAALWIPRLDLELPVYLGANAANMARGGAYSNWVIWLENNALWAGCLLIAAVIGCMLIWRRHRKD